MTRHLVRYTLKPGRAAENEELARAVYAALRRSRPQGPRYATFRLEDGLTYLHLVAHDEADGSNALTALPEFQAFVAGIRERCAELPVTTVLTEVGSYGFFDNHN